MIKKLWNDEGFVVYDEDIKDVVVCNWDLYGTRVTVFEEKIVTWLNAIYKGLDETGIYEDDYEEMIRKTLEIAELDTFVYTLEDTEVQDKRIIFNTYEKKFEDFSDWETERAMQYLDSSRNYKWLYCETETEIEVDDNTETCLDEWNGNDWNNGAVGYHDYSWEVIKIDGKAVEDMFYLENQSQFQGERTTGRLVSKKELYDYININCDQ